MLTVRSIAVVVILFCFLESVGVSGEETWNVEKSYSDVLYQYRQTGITVHEFADRYICGSNSGQFYRILKKQFCKMSRMFIYRYFLKLCQDHRGNRKQQVPTVLDFLVSNFFDTDNDGKIDHFEKVAFQRYGA